MKKNFAILFVLLAIAFRGFAQDTITGVVNRVSAPYFEQNVCDTRFALSVGDETYYVMVDNYWPNPYLEELVIHYDTIPVGNEIEVVGEILEMEDGNREAFRVICINKNLSSVHQQFLGFFGYSDVSFPGPNPVSAARFFHYNGTDRYYITINEELQTATPFVINGRTLVEDKRYLFIGKSNTWIDYNGNPFNVIELADALPYDVADLNIDGKLTMENNLCISSPCGEMRFLSLFDGEEYRYLTNKRKLQNNFFNDAVFMEGDSVVVSGFEFIRHDLFGIPFKTFEIVKLQSTTEHVVVGGIGEAPMPYIGIGPPVPGLDMAFYIEIVNYYLMNPHVDDIYPSFYVVGEDTLYVTDQQVTATLVASLFINNYLNVLYRAYINHVEFEEHEETLQCTLAVTENPFYWGDILVARTQNDETYYLKPYIYEYTAPDHITIGDKTVHVGDSFTATGMVSNWYHNHYYLEKVIDITEINSITDLDEFTPTSLTVDPISLNGIVQVVSERPMESITIYDNMGRVLANKNNCFQNNTLNVGNYKGLAIVYVVFQDGCTFIKKEIIR